MKEGEIRPCAMCQTTENLGIRRNPWGDLAIVCMDCNKKWDDFWEGCAR